MSVRQRPTGCGEPVSQRSRSDWFSPGRGYEHSVFSVELIEYLFDPEDFGLARRRVREKVQPVTGGKQLP